MSLLRELGGLAGDALAAGYRVSVKTNLGPELEVGQGGGGIARALGIKAAVIVRDRNGNVALTYGDPPPTNPVLVVALTAAAALAGFFLVRGVLKK